VILLVFSSGIAWAVAGDWLAAAALWVLAIGWRYLRTEQGPPVLALAFTFQWTQVTIGIYYPALSGRDLPGIIVSDCRPMVVLGLGCLVALLLGLKLGLRLVGGMPPPARNAQGDWVFSWPTLAGFYLGSVAVTGTVQAFAWEIPALTQGILALTSIRLVLLFVIFHRLTLPPVRWMWMILLLGLEVVFGFTGYFAGFREPLMMAAVALTNVFDRRQAKHWVTLGLLLLIMLFTGVLWMGIREGYRQSFEVEGFAESREARLADLSDRTSRWLEGGSRDTLANVDSFVERLWAVYYPALALARVPAIVPYEDGAILWGAVHHILTPRILFPNKPALPSDSEMVLNYSGVYVAGADENTSIAFGYAAESYVDFGVPLMFLPVFVWGVLVGVAYQSLMRLVQNYELRTALVTVVFWLVLYLFERSWINTLGLSVTLIVYLGGATLVLDRLVLSRRRMRPPRRGTRGPALRRG
jgi:hypothetical protein